MKIVSSFVDAYDLQHTMDHEKTWHRESFSYFSNFKLPPNILAAIQYVGRTFLVSKESVSEVSSNNRVTDRDVEEPLVLVIPTDNGGTLVIVNPSTLQIGGIASVESNPYRMHQEIETFLDNRGKLTND